jgi:hypothetical protein
MAPRRCGSSSVNEPPCLLAQCSNTPCLALDPASTVSTFVDSQSVSATALPCASPLSLLYMRCSPVFVGLRACSLPLLVLQRCSPFFVHASSLSPGPAAGCQHSSGRCGNSERTPWCARSCTTKRRDCISARCCCFPGGTMCRAAPLDLTTAEII